MRKVGLFQQTNAMLGRDRAVPFAHQGINQCFYGLFGLFFRANFDANMNIGVANMAKKYGLHIWPMGLQLGGELRYKLPDFTCGNAHIKADMGPKNLPKFS